MCKFIEATLARVCLMLQAVKQYSLAAASDHAEAIYNLALVYLQGGVGVEPDTDQGLALIDKAAKLGLRQVNDAGAVSKIVHCRYTYMYISVCTYISRVETI